MKDEKLTRVKQQSVTGDFSSSMIDMISIANRFTCSKLAGKLFEDRPVFAGPSLHL